LKETAPPCWPKPSAYSLRLRWRQLSFWRW